MAKERVDVLAYKQGLFETREQAKRGVMAGLVVAVLNGERFDKPGEKIPDDTATDNTHRWKNQDRPSQTLHNGNQVLTNT